jgi:hypothetical protein
MIRYNKQEVFMEPTAHVFVYLFSLTRTPLTPFLDH